METEKKVRRPIRADYSVADPEFERVVSSLLGPPLLAGNNVRILQNGDEIFPALLEAIRGAQSTITFENFLWHEGEIAQAVAEALIERARAGVAVHVLQDAFGCDHPRSGAIEALKRSSVDVELFRFLWISRVNFRTHRKLMVVDGKTAFIGGVCIADTWKGNGVTPGFWRDTHYRVEGPAVAQIQQAFLDNWMQTRAEVLHGPKFFPALEPCGSLKCQAFKSSAGEGADSARLMYLLSFAAARQRIQIASGFFLPDNVMIKSLIEARQRRVEVEVIAPGPDNDAPVVRFAGRSRWRPLLEAGVRLFEYEAARFHAKYLVVDDCWCSVGSSNIDHRSLRLNEEANLNVLDREFATTHSQIFATDRSRSRLITLEAWKKRPLSEKALGRAAVLGRMAM